MHEEFEAAFNLGYGHRIEQAGFPDVLESMQRRDIIQGGEGAFGPYIELTATGGALWEQERLPIWAAYCEGETEQRDGAKMLSLKATSIEVIECYLNVAREAGILYPVEGAVTLDRRKPARTVQWKRLELLTATVALEGVERQGRINWVTYESKRIWWRSVPELLRSHHVVRNIVLGDGCSPPLFGASSESRV